MLYQPQLDCRLCIDRLEKQNTTPLCRSERGCPIKHLVLYDRWALPLCESFMSKKLLESHQGYSSIIEQELQRSGLTDISLLIKLEGIYNEWVTWKRKQKQPARKGNKTNGR